MPDEISSNDLAYLGDAVIELLTRQYLVTNDPHTRRHSEAAIEFVCAAAQSDALSRVEALFTEEEADVYRRARNNYHTSNVPKSATALQYRRSTGFEAVFGYLYLKGDVPRARELFQTAYGDIINKEKETERKRK